jgi:hypothetical protein
VEREETAAPAHFSSRIASYFSYTFSEERLSVMPYVLLILYMILDGPPVRSPTVRAPTEGQE